MSYSSCYSDCTFFFGICIKSFIFSFPLCQENSCFYYYKFCLSKNILFMEVLYTKPGYLMSELLWLYLCIVKTSDFVFKLVLELSISGFLSETFYSITRERRTITTWQTTFNDSTAGERMRYRTPLLVWWLKSPTLLDTKGERYIEVIQLKCR